MELINLAIAIETIILILLSLNKVSNIKLLLVFTFFFTINVTYFVYFKELTTLTYLMKLECVSVVLVGLFLLDYKALKKPFR